MPPTAKLVLFIFVMVFGFFAVGRLQVPIKQQELYDRMEIAARIFSCLLAVLMLVVARTTWGDGGFILTLVLILSVHSTI